MVKIKLFVPFILAAFIAPVVGLPVVTATSNASHGSHGEAGAHHTGAETGHPASTPATDGRSNRVTVRQFKSARTRDTRTFLLTDMPSVPEPTEDLQAKPHPDAAGQGPNHGPKRSNTLR